MPTSKRTAVPMINTSIRLTQSQLDALNAAAEAHGTTRNHIIDVILSKGAEKLGAEPRALRKSGDARSAVSVPMSDEYKEALKAYAHANEYSTVDLAVAMLSAARVTLHARGYLTLPPGRDPDGGR